jgi:hypothetical protein
MTLAVLALLGWATLSSAAPLPARRLQKATPLAVGSFCRRHCEDGSQPDVERAEDCPAGTTCAPPPHAVEQGLKDTCGWHAHVCTAQVGASCNMETFQQQFCPVLRGADMADGWDQHAYACAHDPNGAGGIMRGLLGRESSQYTCYTALAGTFAEATFAELCPVECSANHNPVAPSGPAVPGTGGLCSAQAAIARVPGIPGMGVPQCDEQGGFLPVQCYGSIACLCVDSDGTELPGTRVLSGLLSVDTCLEASNPDGFAVDSHTAQTPSVPAPPIGCCTRMGQRDCHPCGALAPPEHAGEVGMGQRCAAGFCEDGNCPHCLAGLDCVVPADMVCAGTCFGQCRKLH